MAVKLDGLTIANKVAKERSGICEATEYKNTQTPMPYKCNICGHRWKATLSNIQKGKWCPKCAIRKQHALQKIDGLKIAQQIAKEKNGECEATIYVNNKTPMPYRCNICGCRWKSKLSHIVAGHWCPGCATNHKEENLLGACLSHLLPKKTIISGFNDFDWQKLENGKCLHFDYYIPELKVAIERDGEQHFRPVRFGGRSIKEAKVAFKKQCHRDKLKDERVADHPEDVKIFIRIPYTEPITKENVTRILRENGIEV